MAFFSAFQSAIWRHFPFLEVPASRLAEAFHPLNFQYALRGGNDLQTPGIYLQAPNPGVSTLFRRARDLVARIHEGAPPALSAQVGVPERRTLLLRAEASRQHGVGPEPGRAAVELALMAQEHAGPAMHGADDAANPHIRAAELAQLADRILVFSEALDGEAAGIIGGIRRAYVQEPGPIGKFHHIIDMRGDADVFVEVLRSLIDGDAGLWRAGMNRGRRSGQQNGEPDEPA